MNENKTEVKVDGNGAETKAEAKEYTQAETKQEDIK